MSALAATVAHYEAQARGARYRARLVIAPSDLRVRAGQLLNEAGDDCDTLANSRREAASYLIEAAHLLDKIGRLSRVADARIVGSALS